MNDMIFDRDYTGLLMTAVANTSTPGAEIEFQLSVAPQSETGFLIVDQGDAVREEILFYHRKSGSSVYVYGINRSNPISHLANANVLLTNSIDALNFLSENTFQQMYIYKTSDKELLVQGGKFYIDGITVDILDLNTLDALADKVLTSGDTNFIAIKDGDYYISTTYDNGLYQIAEVSVNTSGVITNIERNKVFSLSGKTLDQAEITKLSGIEAGAEVNVQADYNESNSGSDSYIRNKPNLTGYEVKTSKTGTIGAVGSTFKYPTTKAVRDELNTKVDKVTGKDLSDNNFTNARITELSNKVDKVTGKGLTENEFTNTDKAKLDGLNNYTGIDFIGGQNVSIQEVVDGSGHKDVTIKAITNVNLGTQSTVLMNTNPLEGAFYENTEWDKYIVLKDKGRNGFDGKVLTPLDADDINGLRVFIKNEGSAGQLRLQILIRVTDGVGAITDTIRSIPFNANVLAGETFFDIPAVKLSGLTITGSSNVYFKIIRDASRSIESHKDTVNGRILISSAVVDFNIPPSVIPAIPNHNYDLAVDSTTGSDDYVVNIGLGPILENDLFLPFIPDTNNTTAATLDYNSTGVKDIVAYDGSVLGSDVIVADKLTFVKYDLANDRWILLGTAGGAVAPSTGYSYEHVQVGVSNSWNVNHNLGTRKLVLQCYDSAGEPIDENTFSFVDDNNIVIDFTGNVAGSATILSSGATPPAPVGDKNYNQTFSNVTGGGTWVHGLGKYPSVVVMDGTGKEVVCDVTHTDINTVNITWTGIYSGRVIAN